MNNLVPGDAVAAPMVVRNDAAADSVYSILVSASNPDGKGLARQIQLTIKKGVSHCTRAQAQNSGETLYGPGPLR